MAERGSDTYLRPNIGEGVADLGRSTLPFADLDRTGEHEGIVVQIKVLTPDDAEGLATMNALKEGLRNIVVNGKHVVPLLTREGIDMSYADKETVANMIAPMVLRRLGIRDGIGGDLLHVIR